MTTHTLLSPGGSTEAKQDSAAVILAAIRDAVLALENLSATVSGTVSVGNFPTTQQVAGSVAVTNPVTSVAVNNLPATQPVSGTVAVSNQPTPQTDALTNTQLRASAVPVTGTVSTGGLTDTQLRATPVPVSGTVAVSNQPTTLATTAINARVTGVLRAASTNANAAQVNTAGATRTVVVLAVPDGHSSSAVEISAASSASQVVFEQSETGADGTWAATNMRRNNTPDVNESFSQIENNPFGTGNVQLWKGTVGGIRFFRVRCNALGPADSAGITVTLETSEGVGGTYLLGNPPSVSDYFSSGTLAAPGDTVECRVSGMGSFAALFAGQWTGTILTESTIDGTTWRPINVLSPSATGGTFLNSISGTGVADQILQVRGGAGGLRAVRLRANTDYNPTAAATGTVRAGAGSSGTYLMAPAPIAGLDNAQTSQVTVGLTAVRLDPAALALRSSVEVKYKSSGAANNAKVYVGFNNAVTASNGRELDPGEAWALDLRASVQLWAIASVAGQVVSVSELA